MRSVSVSLLVFGLAVPLLAWWDFRLFDFVRQIPAGDWIGHVVLGACLTGGLLGLACGRVARARRHRFLACVGAGLLIVAALEVAQIPNPVRAFTFPDLAASCTGVALAAAAFWWWPERAVS